MANQISFDELLLDLLSLPHSFHRIEDGLETNLGNIDFEESLDELVKMKEAVRDFAIHGAAGKERILWREEIKDLRFESSELKTLEMQSREDVFELPCYGNAGDHHMDFSILWEELYKKKCLRQEQRTGLLHDFGECPQNNLQALTGINQVKQMKSAGKRLPLDSNESCVGLFRKLLDWNGKTSSQLQDNSTSCNLNKHKETKPRRQVFQFEDTFNQHKRKGTAQRVSSIVVLAIIFLDLFQDIWSQSSFMKVQPLLTEHVSVSIWSSLLRLLGFMVFVWGVAIMILVGAPFTRLHRAMLFFWAIMMHVTIRNNN